MSPAYAQSDFFLKLEQQHMKIESLRRASLHTAIALLAMGSATTLMGAAPALTGQVSLRPLTPTEIKTYALTGAQGASGMNAVGVGQPAYLDALVNAAIAPSNIVSVTWTLTSKPIGSAATLVTSPLGANVPPGYMADRFNQAGVPASQVADRRMLRPDMTGQYTVTAAIVTAGGSGSTNITVAITAGTYVGVQTCELCHSGGAIAMNKYTPWSQTPHATFFTRAIDGLESDHYSKNCISCHTVGYDTNTNAVNGGFDDIATQLSWNFPTILTNGNWAALPPALKNLANIQCENCHGPGSEHAYALGNTNISNWPRIGKTYLAGTCAQCHDSTPNHSKSAEWNNSIHARTTRTPTGPGREACARCHTAGGFDGYATALSSGVTYTTNNANTTYTSITCQTCHDPHDASNPHQLRLGESVLLADGLTTVTNAGAGALCMNCHRSRNGSVTNSIVQYALLQQTWAGGSSFGPHDSPSSDMLEGVNGWTYGKVIPSSAHRGAVTDTCVGCHMQTVTNGDPAFLQAGGHTWNMTYTNSLGATLDKVDVCVQCHGPMTSFDLVKVDYNGDGVIEGVQTEVQHLLDKLSTMLPNGNFVANGNYVADGLVKTSISTRTNWPAKFLEAGYNWQFVNNDSSKGVHNAAYAVGLLKASIADLTGDANNDGIADSWQIQYFGSTSNPAAAPTYCAAGDGIPNWVKYSLGLNPLIPGVVLPDGVVWANAGPNQNSPTNSIQIYTAAEITFNTEVGKTYQLQSITSLGGGGWLNVGDPVPGTGDAYSFMTPTRNNSQQYYRVVHTP
jgi:hypothetical protein